MKPREFVKEFQRRAGLLIDGIPGPQTEMALWLIDVNPPEKRLEPAKFRHSDLPPGDYWLTSVGDGKGRAVMTTSGMFLVEQFPEKDGSAYWADLTHLLGASSWKIEPRSEVDPDAEAVAALRSASWDIRYAGERMDPLPGIPEAGDMLAALRAIGWDVTRRQP